MTKLELMYQAAQEYADEVETSIFEGKFTFMQKDKHSCDVEIDNIILTISTSSFPEHTRIIKARIHTFLSSDFPHHRFKNPPEIRSKILSRHADQMMDPKRNVSDDKDAIQTVQRNQP